MRTYDNQELDWFASFIDGVFGTAGEKAIEQEAEKRLHEIAEALKDNPCMVRGSIAESVLEWWLHR